jgi:uncharacterized surface protein with fasciclin (FAS1) repeats
MNDCSSDDDYSTAINFSLFFLQLEGIKTYTVLAPTDLAFSHLTQDELNTLVSDKDSAQLLVQRHILPGTLFTSGMRFYQVKDTLAEDKAVTVQKNGGEAPNELP